MAPVMPLADSRARASRALELRAARWTWQKIADELDFRSPAGARLAVSRLIAATTGPDTTTTARAITVAKLDDQDRRLYPRFVAATDAGDDENAVKLSKELRGIADTAARIGGIAAPARIEVGVEVSFTDAIAQARNRLLAVENAIDAEVIEAEAVEP